MFEFNNIFLSNQLRFIENINNFLISLSYVGLNECARSVAVINTENGIGVLNSNSAEVIALDFTEAPLKRHRDVNSSTD